VSKNGVGRGMQSHPNANAPDHCKRKPRRADTKTAVELFTSHLKDRTPGGSIHGINAPRKKTVIGVVFHINLQSQKFHVFVFTSHNIMFPGEIVEVNSVIKHLLDKYFIKLFL